MKHSTCVSSEISSNCPIGGVHGGGGGRQLATFAVSISGTCGGLWVEKYLLRKSETLFREKKVGLSPPTWEVHRYC